GWDYGLEGAFLFALYQPIQNANGRASAPVLILGIIKARPPPSSRTSHPLASLSTHSHPQSTCRAGKLFRGSRSTPSLRRGCSPFAGATWRRRISLSFLDPRSRCPRRSLRVARLCAGISRKFSRGWLTYTRR